MDSVIYSLRTREMGLKTSAKRKNKRMLMHSLRKFAEDRGAKPDTNKPFEMSRKAKSTLVLELSPDGKYVASSHGDHSIRVSEISSGKCIKTLTGHTRSPWTMSFHSTYIDVLASGCIAGEVRVWDLKSGESDSWNFQDKKAICSVAFHPILPVLMIAVADRIYAWDWTGGKPYHLCTAPKPDQIRWLKFHPTGNWLYTGISNGFVDFSPKSRHTSSNNYFWQFLHGERSRWRSNNTNNTENNNDDEDNDDEDRFRGIFVLGHQPRNPNRSGRGSRRGVFVPNGEREESSAEEEAPDDYLVFPTRERNQERRYRSPFVNYTRDRSGGETSSRPRTSSRSTDYLGQVRDIWQQRLGRRYGQRGDGRNRERGYMETSPERDFELSGLEERVYRRLNSSLFEHPFRRLSTSRENSDHFSSAGLVRDQSRRQMRYSNLVGGSAPENEEAPTTSSSLLMSNSRGNDSLRRILDIDIPSSHREPHGSMEGVSSSIGSRLFQTSSSGTSFQNLRMESSRMSVRSSRRSALLRSDPILSDYGGLEESLFIRSSQQDLEASGTSESMHISEPHEDDALVLDLSMNLEVEVNNAASSGAISSMHDSLDVTRGVRTRDSGSEPGDQLHVDVEEHLNNLSDMSLALRSGYNRLREYINEIDAAAAPGAEESTTIEVMPQDDVPLIEDVNAAGHGTSTEVSEGRDGDQPSSNVVQLGTLNDLFAAALGGDNGLSGLNEPMPSTSGGQSASESNKGVKRRRSEHSSDEEYLYSPMYHASVPVQEAGDSSLQSDNSASNSSFAAVSNVANSSGTTETLVNTSSHSAASSSNSGSSNTSSFQRDDIQGESSDHSAPVEGTSRTVAVVFTFNSPTLSPTRFATNPWVSPRPTGQENSRNNDSTRRTSPFRSLGRRGDEFVAINDPEQEDDDDDEMEGGSTDSIARDHNYIPFSRGGGSNRRLDLSSGSSIGEGSLRADRNSRMTFMETFFLRRRRDAASTSSRSSTVTRPHAYMFNPSLRNRFRVPTPPRNNPAGSSATSNTNGSSRRRSFWRFFNSSSNRGGVGDDDDIDMDEEWSHDRGRRSRDLRRRNQRYPHGRRVSFTSYEDVIDDDDDDIEDVGRSNNSGAGVRSNSGPGSDDDIPLFGSRMTFYRLPRTTREPDGRSRLFDFNPSFSSTDHVSFRIQAWNFNSKVCIDLKKIYKNIVVPYASIHSDASVDISQDGRMLCTFVITEKTQTQRKEVGLFSLEPSTLGACLCLINLDSTAISLSISPSNHYLLVGVSTGRYELSILKPVVCSIYKLRLNSDKELTADFISDITHLSSDWSSNSIDLSINLGANCARWFLGSGEGFVYGTNKGDMVARSHKLYNPELWQRRDRENQERPRAEPGMPWSWFGAGQMRLADFLIWSAQNNMNIGPVIV